MGANMCEGLSVESINRFLHNPDPAQNIHIYPTVESTNTTAKEMAKAGAKHGAVVMAESQSLGRGRRGRSFFSPAGTGIYMSLVLKPIPPIPLTAFAAVSVCKAIENLTEKKPDIKWPNDLLLHGKKICGILAESIGNNSEMPCVVVGIGINFMNPAGSFPSEIEDTAGAIFSEGEPAISRNRLAAEIINRMTAKNLPPAKSILASYKSRMSMLGSPIKVICPNETYEAIAQDVDLAGGLVVLKENGQKHNLTIGEITIRPKSSCNTSV